MTGHVNQTQLHDPVQFDPRHPRHSEGTREGNALAGIVALVGLIGFWLGWLDVMPAGLAIALIVAAALAARSVVMRQFSHRAAKSHDQAQAEYRANIEAERQLQLAEMRAKEQREPRP